MVYSSNFPVASSAMERDRLGEYPECEDECCPICGSINPDCFYVNADMECVGCSECVDVKKSLL